MTERIWEAGATEHAPVAASYVQGIDHELDQVLLPFDIEGCRAHAKVLENEGVITAAERQQLDLSLDQIDAEHRSGGFVISPDQEDGHTAIEQRLTAELGDLGKKLHTFRSRNDQSLVMLRLYMRSQLATATEKLSEVAKVFGQASVNFMSTPLPGYTHMQKAMPTTVGIWLGSFADGFSDSSNIVRAATRLVDQNPLGSAAGFGLAHPINREISTEALGFSRTQDNPMYCGLSRGLFELTALQSLSMPMILAGRFARDMLAYTTQEFSYLSLPDRFLTGSSIMPQKKNYDLFEIMRGNVSMFQANLQAIASLTAGMGSGYQRDLQLTKAKLLDSFNKAISTLEVLIECVPELQINEDRLASSITTEMHSADKANELARQGIPFRDAYKQIKQELDD